MRWFTTRRLVRTYGIRWTEAERIVREECLRSGRGRTGLVLSLIHLTGLGWLLFGAHWLFPSVQGWMRMGIESPGLLVSMIVMLVPRLLARDAMRARAEALAATGDRSEQLPLR
ncbi:hypothetical protein ATSB10_29490 [Dyella thiooxydans]|uniref:Uncharacterized protein n=1 Tax=Dyella thiooxydans TaxID=445710 RepID=A0A160N367_9GAMM|nr:hypothetical protein [Dyella thiooxydans]AND70403.1 hypothetical protein ATSB10_29490 [Dyella thiooxydans]